MISIFSFVCCMTVACILLPRQSTGHGNYLHEDKWFAADRQQDANAQSARKMLLDAFLRKILQETALLESTHAEENLLNLDDQNAIEETDQLTTITRYVGVGYNLLRGSPDGDFERGGVDPGILSTGVIFEFTYDKGKEAYFMDSPMQVPDQVNFQPASSCSTRHKSSVYSGAKSYQKSLNIGVDAGVTLKGVRFGLSAAVKRANEDATRSKRVFIDRKGICNYGRVQYLKDEEMIHKLSNSFYNRVKKLPQDYDMDAYMGFIRDWGTSLIVKVDVGTKTINRSFSTYSQVYKKLTKQNSGGISLGGSFAGYGANLGLDIGYINLNSKNSTRFETKMNSFTIGTEKNPLPIYLSLVDISEALKPKYWTTLPEKGASYDSLKIVHKQRNLEMALKNYADYEGVSELKDPSIQIKYNWPNGQYALPATKSGCPKHWSRGASSQRTGGESYCSPGITTRMDLDFGETIKTRYCVKTKVDMDEGFEWPEGSYCIARKEDLCPLGFEDGSIRWHDKKSKNKKWGVRPDGEYGKYTRINYCCRSDGEDPDTARMLPIGHPFILYRYGGSCQNISGTTVHEDFIKFDSSYWLKSLNKNECTGSFPDDDNCKGDHVLHFCYYSKK